MTERPDRDAQRISDLIAALEAVRAKHGDLPVVGFFDAGYGEAMSPIGVYRELEGRCAVDFDGAENDHLVHPDDRAAGPDPAGQNPALPP